MHPFELSPAHKPPTRLPTAEQWELLGGKPQWWVPKERIEFSLESMKKPRNISYVIHPDGVVVDTPIGDSSTASGLSEAMQKIVELQVSNMTIHIPAFLLWELHGKPCEERSGGENYLRLGSAKEHQEFVKNLARKKFVQIL